MVRQQYYGAKDIQAMLGIGKTKANEILHELEHKNKLYRVGRLLRVKATDFNDWMEGNGVKPRKAGGQY